MDREIKFRAWDKELKRYAFYELVNGEIEWLSDFNSLDKNREPEQQYTGLKDKDGKEIYEGDIVINDVPSFKTNEKWKVEWHKLSGSYHLHSIDNKRRYGGMLDLLHIKIIGNIYETKT